MKKPKKILFLTLTLCLQLFTSCCQKCNSDDDFRTVPVTNNPNAMGARPSTPGMPY